MIVEHPLLQDGSTEAWPADTVASHVRDFVQNFGIKTVRAVFFFMIFFYVRNSAATAFNGICTAHISISETLVLSVFRAFVRALIIYFQVSQGISHQMQRHLFERARFCGDGPSCEECVSAATSTYTAVSRYTYVHTHHTIAVACLSVSHGLSSLLVADGYSSLNSSPICQCMPTAVQTTASQQSPLPVMPSLH